MPTTTAVNGTLADDGLQVFGFTVPEAAPVTLDPAEHTAQVWLPWQQAMEKTFSPTNRDAIRQLSQRRRT